MSHWTIESRTRAADAVLTAAPVVPVIQIERPEQAVPLARCLVDAGLCVLEITLRSDVALGAGLREVDLETFFWEMVRQAPEIAPLIANAELRDDGLGIPRAQRDAFIARLPFGEPAQPEHVARVALFFASALSDWVTGQTINVSGGHQIP